MAKDHYIPAAFMGRFSDETKSRSRYQRVWVFRRGADHPRRQRPENIGHKANLYGDDLYDATVDNIWKGFEQRLGATLSALCRGENISADNWLRVLVPFVASIFIRGNDFGGRFERRYDQRDKSFDSVFTCSPNSTRLQEFQRLIPTILTAYWLLYSKSGGVPFVSNDLAIAMHRDAALGRRPGWIIPVGPNHALGPFPLPGRELVRWDGHGWNATIERRTIDRSYAPKINNCLAHCSQEFILGGSELEVIRAASYFPDHPPTPETIFERWQASLDVRLAHEYEWHRLVTAVTKPLDELDATDLQHYDPKIIGKGWAPPPFVAVGAPEFPTGLRLNGDSISLALSRPSPDVFRQDPPAMLLLAKSWLDHPGKNPPLGSAP